jgi:hypothetical protein
LSMIRVVQMIVETIRNKEQASTPLLLEG